MQGTEAMETTDAEIDLLCSGDIERFGVNVERYDADDVKRHGIDTE